MVLDDFYHQAIGEKRQGLSPAPARLGGGEVEQKCQAEKGGGMAEFVIDIGYRCLIQLAE
jgi:hypothetical protein